MSTHKFQAEVTQLLHIVVHSLYSKKEVFLRELISNASDALNKLRFASLTEPALLEGDPKLEIRIWADREKQTITIEDSGIGMTESELVEHLGTIARSGSKEFLQKLATAGTESKDALQLIGQFGVGFYSAFLVSDKVEVISRHAAEQTAHRWISDAKESFEIEPAERTARGTSITLYLQKDCLEYLEDWRLRELVSHYSDFVSHPILLQVEKDKEKVFETINQSSALWQRPKSEITDEQYQTFYKHLTDDSHDPLAHIHFTIEGSQQFVGLLYLPEHPDPDFYYNPTAKRGVRLFVSRVFIMEDCDELLPPWLKFIRGVVDSDDLPLNVSRELLQDSAPARAIKKQVTKKSIEMLDALAKDKPEAYVTFWKSFGAVLKTGIPTDFEHRDRIADLLRFTSSATGALTSLADYIGRMKEGQEAIFFVLGESVTSLASSPHVEALAKKDFEVLYLTDPVDDWVMEALHTYRDKKIVSAMHADVKVDSSAEAKTILEAKATSFKSLLDFMKEVLGDKVKEVRVTDRLADSPACLVVEKGGTHGYVERLFRERGQMVHKHPRSLEINPQHPLVLSMFDIHAKNPGDAQLRSWTELLFDQAVLTEGNSLEDPGAFSRKITELLTQVAAAKAVKSES